MQSRFSLYKQKCKQHGLGNAFYLAFINFTNKFFYFRVLRCLVINKINDALLEMPSQFEHGFLGFDRLKEYSIDAENELGYEFLKSTLEKKDDCYAIKDGDVLASYGWYSHGHTLTDIQNLIFCFDPKYVYMYKGLTKKEYRGQRLHAIGMNWALKCFLENGASGMVSYVDTINFDSLKSCWRMGYEDIGVIAVVKIFGRIFLYSSPSCKQYNIHLKPAF